MELENTLFLELSPYKIGLVDVFCDLEPKPFLKYCLNQVWIISLSYKNLEGYGVFINLQRYEQVISEIDSEQKLPKFLQFYVDWRLLPDGLIHIDYIHFFLQNPSAMLSMS